MQGAFSRLSKALGKTSGIALLALSSGFATTTVQAQQPTMSFAAADGAVFEVEEGSTVDLIITASPAPTGDLTVNYRIEDDGDPDTADADIGDYTNSAGSVTFEANAVRATIPITIADDDEIEPLRERFTVSVASGAGYQLGSQRTVTVVINEGVCDVTPQIRTNYLNEYNEENGDQFALSMGTAGCADVAAAVTYPYRIRLGGDSLMQNGLEIITELKAFDFLHLHWGETPSADSVFEILLDGNRLTSLPEEVFRGQGNTKVVELGHNRLNSLPATVFRDLRNLRRLFLDDNRLRTLPPGIFSGLSNLGLLWLQDNPGEPFQFELAFEPPSLPGGFSGSAEFRLVMTEGAPRRIEVTLDVVGGVLSSTEMALAIGSTQSSVFTFTRDPGGRPFSLTQRNLAISGGIPGFSEKNIYKGFEIVSGAPVEQLGTLSIELDGVETVEGTTIKVVMRLSPALPAPLVVDYVIEPDDNPATVDADADDYTDLSGGTVTVAAGETSVTISIRIDDDDEIESPRERFKVSVVAGDGYTLAAPSSAIVVIKEGVCDRLAAVQTNLLAVIGEADDCSAVTSLHLANIGPALMFDGFNDEGMTLKDLSAEEFSGLTGVTELTIRRSRLSHFPPTDLFSAFGALRKLHLVGINSAPDAPRVLFPSGIFQGLDVLEELWISESNQPGTPRSFTKISGLEADLFQGLGDTLRRLRLDGNLLRQTWISGLFSGLSKLERLDLSDNDSRNLPSGFFSDLSGLERLDLSGNGLRSLSSGFFSGLSGLERLDLSDNELQNLPSASFSRLSSSLAELFLQENELTGLPERIFEGLSGLGGEAGQLWLHDNPKGDPQDLIFTVELRVSTVSETSGYRLAAELAQGAPFTLTIPSSITQTVQDTSLPTEVTIPAGSTRSESFELRREVPGIFEVALGKPPGRAPNLVPTDSLPGSPVMRYRGFDVVVSAGIFTLPNVATVEFDPRAIELVQGGAAATFTVTLRPMLLAGESATVTLTAPDGLSFADGSSSLALPFDHAETSQHEVEISADVDAESGTVEIIPVLETSGVDPADVQPPLRIEVLLPQVAVEFKLNDEVVQTLMLRIGEMASVTVGLAAGHGLQAGQEARLMLSAEAGGGLTVTPAEVTLNTGNGFEQTVEISRGPGAAAALIVTAVSGVRIGETRLQLEQGARLKIRVFLEGALE